MLITCHKCKKEFSRKPSQVAGRKFNYCSKKCMLTSVNVKCSHCNNLLTIFSSVIKRGQKNFFCNRECQRNFIGTGTYEPCSNCAKMVYRQKNQTDKYGQRYCSNKCKSMLFRRAYKVKCDCCGKEFEKPPADQKRTKHNYCSLDCHNKSKLNRIEFKCNYCKEKVERPVSLVKGKKNVFCSEKCANKFQDTKITIKCLECGIEVKKSPVYVKRNVRHFCSANCSSKWIYNGGLIEKVFEEMISKLNIPFSKNDRNVLWERLGKKIFNNNKRFKKEIDFYFPTIEYGVEINGPVHYAPIFGDTILQKQKKRDRIKREMCKKCGIKLRRVWIKSKSKAAIIRQFRQVIKEIKRRVSAIYTRMILV